MNIFLKKIRNPIQYLGMDLNIAKKDWDSTKVKFLLAFPDTYEIGSSNLGIQILYHIINSNPSYLCDRIFAPDFDKKFILEGKIPYLSVDNQKHPRDFDIIAFSLQYELAFPTILSMLKFMNIPLFAEQRIENQSIPIICAGGPAVFNPLPVSPFFDFFLIGDGEEAVIEKCQIIESLKGRKKIEILTELAKIEGVYSPLINNNNFVKKRTIPFFKNTYIPDKPIVPITKSVHNRATIEVSRGCTRGCRFCQAGIIYRPVREKTPEQIFIFSKKIIENTGYREIGLLSLSIGDYSNLENLVLNLKNLNCSISLPSIRIDKLNDNIMSYISEREKTGFTVAPEAGSERLRRIINKNLTNDDIYKGVETVFKNGWQLLKLYFMIGLPFEEFSDIEEIVYMVKHLKKIAKKNRINVSVSTFVPKPHTPFQWNGQIPLLEIKEKLNFLKSKLKKIKYHKPEMSLIESVLSRGDINISNLIYEVYKQGAYLDAWTDRFDFNCWVNAGNSVGIDISKEASKKFLINETLPWDFIDTGVKKDFLINEFKKAEKELQSEDCRYSKCNQCGVCDGDLKNFIAPESNLKIDNIKLHEQQEYKYKRVIFKYSKKDFAAFIGHIDLSNVLTHALLKTGLDFKFSQGFKPKLKIQFTPPSPFGVESLDEYFEVFVNENDFKKIDIKIINNFLPNGLRIEKFFENTHNLNLNKILKASSYIIFNPNIKINPHELIEEINYFSDKIQIKIKYDNGKHINIVKLIKESNIDIDPDTLKILREKFYFDSEF